MSLANPLVNPNPPDITTFATTSFRHQERLFGIKKDDRRRHMYLLGQTGTGKSTLQENLILRDIQAGNGVAVVDPHGDMVEKLTDYIPLDRIEDVVYFNPADAEFPIAFNILENVDPMYKPLVASGLVGVFKKIWADSWGPRLEYILMNTILALIDYEGSTLLSVTRMLVDKNYRKKVVDALDDPQVRSFWVDEFANYNEKFRSEAISPIQNKVGQFLSSAIIRNIVGQPKSTIDMRTIMDGKKILLINLSKGRIGEENSALLGAMMITKMQLAAMSRVDTPEAERKDFYLYVDEFQNFSTESFAQILSEARKYRLCLILAHQYIDQLDEAVQFAVFGNCGSFVIFRVGNTDAEFLENQFDPYVTPQDLVNIPNFNFYIRLMIDGVTSKPFSAKGLPPIGNPTGSRQQVIDQSRALYARSKVGVEENIRQWAGMTAASVAELVADQELPKFVRKVEPSRGSTASRPNLPPMTQAPAPRPSEQQTPAAAAPVSKVTLGPVIAPIAAASPPSQEHPATVSSVGGSEINFIQAKGEEVAEQEERRVTEPARPNAPVPTVSMSQPVSAPSVSQSPPLRRDETLSTKPSIPSAEAAPKPIAPPSSSQPQQPEKVAVAVGATPLSASSKDSKKGWDLPEDWVKIEEQVPESLSSLTEALTKGGVRDFKGRELPGAQRPRQQNQQRSNRSRRDRGDRRDRGRQQE